MPTKSLIQSKIFWLALVNFVLAIAAGITHKTVGPTMAEDIVSLDWGNISQALLSVGIILARWFFTGTRIGGVFTAVPRVYFLLILFFASLTATYAQTAYTEPVRLWQWRNKPALERPMSAAHFLCGPVAGLLT